jgi:hypothetical protein
MILYETENPQEWSTWTDFGTWAMGIVGVNIWQHMTAMNTVAPVATVQISVAGITVSGPASMPGGAR